MDNVKQNMEKLLFDFKCHRSVQGSSVETRERKVAVARKFLESCVERGRWPGRLAPEDFEHQLTAVRESGSSDDFEETVQSLLDLISFLGDRRIEPSADAARRVVTAAPSGRSARGALAGVSRDDVDGLPRPGFAKHVVDALQAAGYDVTDNVLLSVGTFAYNVAVELLAHVRRETVSSTGGRHAVPPFSARLIPRLAIQEDSRREIDALEQLLLESPALKSVRFPGMKCLNLVESLDKKALSAGRAISDREILEARDKFVRRHIPVEFFSERVPAALRAAALEEPEDEDRLRVLASGLIWCELERAALEELTTPTPLRSLLFAVSASECDTARMAKSAMDMLASLGPEQAEALGQVDFDPKALEARFGPDELDELTGDMEEVAKAICKQLEDFVLSGQCPVFLPLASGLPAVMELTLRRRELGDKKWTSEALSDALSAGLDDFSPEDGRLFAKAVGEWLSDHPDVKKDVRRKLEALRTLVTLHGFSGSIDWQLLRQAFLKSRFHFFEFERGVEAPTEQRGSITSSMLEQEGDCLLAAGYPKTALRTWKLCEKLGPVPDSVKAKIEKLGE